MSEEMPKFPGVYKITCVPTAKFYIGSSVNVKKRCHVHKYHLNRNTHTNRHLQHAWLKYGPDAFIFDLIELVSAPTALISREQWHIETLKPHYNMNPVGATCRGLKHSDETKQKISAAHKGRTMSEAQRTALKAQVISLEMRQRISSALKGRKWTDERRAKQPPVTAEARAKAAQSNREREPSPKQIEHYKRFVQIGTAAAAEANRGRKPSAEHLARMQEGKRRAAEARKLAIDNPQKTLLFVPGKDTAGVQQ